MSEQIKKKNKLLGTDGKVLSYGYADSALLEFNKECAKNKNKIKEQDSYYISNSRFALCLSIFDWGKMAVLSACVVDCLKQKCFFKHSKIKKDKSKSILSLSDEVGNSVLKTDDAEFKFEKDKNNTHLVGYFNNFFDKDAPYIFTFDLMIDKTGIKNCFLESSCFKNPYQFCLANTTCGMGASGRFSCEGNDYGFFEQDTYASCDFTMALLPSKTTVRTACIQTKIDGNKDFGIKLSMGPGNNEVADKSMIYIGDKIEFVDEVKIYIQKQGRGKDFLGTWTFYSSDGKVELTFEPFIQNKHKLFGGLNFHNHHQVFGYYSGKIKCDDGNVLKLDKTFGYAEYLNNLFL